MCSANSISIIDLEKSSIIFTIKEQDRYFQTFVLDDLQNGCFASAFSRAWWDDEEPYFIKIWNYSNASLIKTITNGSVDVINLISLNKTYILGSTLNGSLNIWNIDSGSLVKSVRAQSYSQFILLKDGTLAASTNFMSQIDIWYLSSESH